MLRASSGLVISDGKLCGIVSWCYGCVRDGYSGVSRGRRVFFGGGGAFFFLTFFSQNKLIRASDLVSPVDGKGDFCPRPVRDV